MNPSSERLVVFVTPAQKRVFAARAARLGISSSELLRRAVLAFDDTGEEVRAAGLVDRLSAAPSLAVDSDALRRLAAGHGLHREPAKPRPGARTAAAEGAEFGPKQAVPSLPKAAVQGPAAQADTACSPQDEPPSGLPVAAPVARALAAQAQPRPDGEPDSDDEALVARVIANESRGLSGF